jgi:endoribonuclease Dicer
MFLKLRLNHLAVLADVVESIIGAAYFYDGLTLGYEGVKYFDLGLKWEPIPARISQILRRVDVIVKERDSPVAFPRQMTDVEHMLGYTFKRKPLLIEALTHASYQNDEIRASSYERMEFLGDSILDLIVNDYLYRAPGKNYTPGHIFLRKCAVVNAHILAYVCLNTSTKVEAYMPEPNAVTGVIEEIQQEHEIHLSKCLLHSSSRILEDQTNTFTRFRRVKPEIEQALNEGVIFPWAALTRLQAPKFLSDMVESLIGAVFLDSEGSMETVENVLKKLGIINILEHIVTRDVDVLHPVSRLSLWAQRTYKSIEYDIGREGGKVYCRVLVDGTELEDATTMDEFRGKASQEEVKFAAAEAAIKVLRLRDVGVSYESTKKKKKPRPKKKRAEKKSPSLGE